MDFKTNKIRKKKPKVKKLEKRNLNSTEPRSKERTIKLSLQSIAIVFVIILLLTGIVKAISSINFNFFIKIAGEDLQTDLDGNTNFLLLGTGGKNHEGSDLTDTIILASINHEESLISMLSIPRDLYINDDEVGSSRINEVYHYAKNYLGSNTEGLKHLTKKVEENFNREIHYYLTIDFKGFTELVDAIGGIDLTVHEAINDPLYPKDGTYEYEPFIIAAGPQHLDGATALKYVRSRKTTSDFDRAARQQQVIYAIKQKALSTEVIFSREKINNILNTIKNNLDTNLSVKELLTIGSFSESFTEDKISQKLIHDDPNRCGGFLYTPERQYYNNQFVLIPAGGTKTLQNYSRLIFEHPQIAQQDTKIHLLNGTDTVGVAGETKQILKRLCFDVIRFGNASTKNVKKTTYYYLQKTDSEGQNIDSRPVDLDYLQTIIPGEESSKIPEEYKEYLRQADLIIEFGEDYVNSKHYMSDPFLSLPPPKAASESSPSENTEANKNETESDTNEATTNETE